ncbi:MAG: PKD domain-containing protein, partial [Cytophagaceae bacterium]|nr:PKD domain-containing protein [Cytophagaceae bacterium]
GADYSEWCETEFNLKASKPDYGQGMWSFVTGQGGGNIDNPNRWDAHITNLRPGLNVLRWTVSVNGQCPKYDEISIVNNTPTNSNAGTDVEDCKNYVLLDGNRFDANAGESGEWSLISGYGEIVDVLNSKSRVNNLAFGKNIFQWKIQRGSCVSVDTVVVFNQVPDQSFAGDPQTVCETHTMLNANAPAIGTGTWTIVKGSGTFTNPNSADTEVTNLGFGENIFRWAITYGVGCTTESSVSVRSDKAEAYAGEPFTVYVPRAELNANKPREGLTGRWTTYDGSSNAIIENPENFRTWVTNLDEGGNTFVWTIDVNGCVAQEEVRVEYKAVPYAAFDVDVTEGCYPLSVEFTNLSESGANAYEWDFNDGTTSASRNVFHTFEQPGVYNVQLIAPGPDGKDGIADTIITVWDHPKASFGVQKDLVYIPDDKAIFFDYSTDAVQWYWQFGDGNISEEQSPTHEYQMKGKYDVSLKVTNSFGCVDSITLAAIEALQQGFIAFPNAFMPRPGDSQSAAQSATHALVFKPVYKDVDASSFVLQIFNRWGQLIYETHDIEEGWDGYHEGEFAPQAVYTYRASGKFISGKEFREAGTVMLVR